MPGPQPDPASARHRAASPHASRAPGARRPRRAHAAGRGPGAAGGPRGDARAATAGAPSAADATPPLGDGARDTTARGARNGDTIGEVARWGMFSSALVLVVLLTGGSSVGAALGTSIGLAAVTWLCRFLLRCSERSRARQADRCGPHRGRHGPTGAGAHRGARHQGSV